METKGETIDNKFLLKNKISSGSFGDVYCGVEIKMKDYVAIKLDKSPEDFNNSTLLREIRLLEMLEKVKGIPKLISSGIFKNRNYIVLPLLGRDLSYFIKKIGKFSLKTTICLAVKILNIIKNIHKNSILHRDIKPENILFGRGQDKNSLYITDFGISKIFRDNEGRHLKFRVRKDFIGTSRYASVSSHLGQELSRKDDLESFGYMLVYFLKGFLPWQKVKFTDVDRIKNIGKLKKEIELTELCKDLPKGFVEYFEYVKKLGFYERPNYEYVNSIFMKIANEENIELDYKWDWLYPSADPIKEWKTEEFGYNGLLSLSEQNNRRLSVGWQEKSRGNLEFKCSFVNGVLSSAHPSSMFDSEYKEEDANFIEINEFEGDIKIFEKMGILSQMSSNEELFMFNLLKNSQEIK